MIRFKCWYCGRKYSMEENRIGAILLCSCQYRVRVPRRSGGRSRVRSPIDWLVEVAVYGGCGAMLGFGLGVLLLSRIPFLRRGKEIVVASTALGLLAGAIFGEAGINWIGRRIRDREE